MAKKPTTTTVQCTATCDLFEDGNRYAKGDTFETTPERAEALGDTVTFEAPKDAAPQ